MNSLHLIKAIRKGSPNITERHYLDFSVSGTSLKKIIGHDSKDLISPFGWGDNKEYQRHQLKIFRLQQPSDLSTGRVAIYVCPECGDIACGAVTVNILDLGDRIVWKDFGYETDNDDPAEYYTEVEPIEFDRQSYFTAFSIL